ncbi:Head domain of trimeric autotransporter adhesin [Flavobacteriaceae bacterium MAR_2010_188]|nr:Head domain of trimeric autotransporter adhesin [Flavobacteriaceae bacterium MAR_2010_188]
MRTTIFFGLVFLFSFMIGAQNGINYKAQIKDGSGTVLTSQNVTVQFSILKGAGQATIYTESHNPNTDSNGLVILNIGEGTSSFGDFATIDWGSDAHYLNVQIDTGSGLTEMGTTEFKAVPYALNVSGLQSLDEGNGTGWRLVGTDPENYGPIGEFARDLSISDESSTTNGATGLHALSLGRNTTASGSFSSALGAYTTASGDHSLAMGIFSTASGNRSFAGGNNTLASGSMSTAMGFSSNSQSYVSFVIGQNNIGGGTADAWIESDPLFEIGNGTDQFNRNNALTVLKNGTITAPSFDIGEVSDAKALITKEYAEANFQNTGLEKITDGQIGWRLAGSDLNNFASLGASAVDLSKSFAASNVYGASGGHAFASGQNVTASGNYSTAMGFGSTAAAEHSIALGNTASTAIGASNSVAIGYLADAQGVNSISLGFGGTASGALSATLGGSGNLASGSSATALGYQNISDDQYATVVGYRNDNTATNSSLFQVGNGSATVRSNAFTVLMDGKIIAPSLDIGEIVDSKALITKEYAEANFQNTGLEKITDGQIGWRLAGSDLNNFGSIGASAVDLSKSFAASNVYGASGGHAFASGQNVTASGNYSTAMGLGSTAAAEHSIAIGRNASTSSTASNALAIGYLSSAEGVNSISLGFGGTASGALSATLGGSGNVASGSTATAIGYQNISDDQYSTVVGYKNDNTATNSSLFQVGNGSSTTRSNAFTVFSNGNAQLSGTLTQNSDRRLKDNIRSLDYGLKEILKLESVSYIWKRNPENGKSFGLIAQDVKKVLPEIVSTSEDEQQTLSISYTELIPILINAIKEQQAIIDNQNLKISNLEASNDELQSLASTVEALKIKVNNLLDDQY